MEPGPKPNARSSLRPHRQWADSYGPRWYLHKDGTPPLDDDNDYEWNGGMWVPIHDDHDDA